MLQLPGGLRRVEAEVRLAGQQQPRHRAAGDLLRAAMRVLAQVALKDFSAMAWFNRKSVEHIFPRWLMSVGIHSSSPDMAARIAAKALSL